MKDAVILFHPSVFLPSPSVSEDASSKETKGAAVVSFLQVAGFRMYKGGGNRS